jgi:fatty acid synthase, animal type
LECLAILISFRIWKSYGVEILISTADITTKSGCEQLIQESMKLGPIGGIFNLAGVLRDAIFENQDETKFLECFKPKVFATKYLDEFSRKLCPELEYFVVFSSISCGRGNAGQSNYGMANSITERIVEQRHKNGFPGKAIQWGPIAEVGMLANMQKNKEMNGVFGMIPQKILSCMDTLDNLLTCSNPIVSSMVVAEKRKDLKDTKNLIETLMIAMGIPDIKSIKLDVPIAELGMDSLGGAEIQQTLEREFGLVMTFQELKSITLNELQSRISGKKNSEKIQNISSFMNSIWKNLHNGMIFDKTIEEFQVVKDSMLPKLLIIPGMIGGVGQIWSKLQCSVYILQHVQLFSMTRFDEIYQAVEQNVLELFKTDEKFVLVGYSFGSMIALRICEKLESLGKSGKLVCIDGTPTFMKTNMMTSLPENPSDEDIQNLIFSEFTVKTYGAMADEILNNIWQQATWKAKVDEFTKLIVDQKSKEFVTQNLEALFNRMKIILEEDKTKFTISKNTSVVLIKPSESTLKIESDYGLKEYCKHEIRIETIEGDHYTIIENEKIIEIINSS